MTKKHVDTTNINDKIKTLSRNRTLTIDEAYELLQYLSNRKVLVNKIAITAAELKVKALEYNAPEIEKTMEPYQLYEICSPLWAKDYSHQLLMEYLDFAKISSNSGQDFVKPMTQCLRDYKNDEKSIHMTLQAKSWVLSRK